MADQVSPRESSPGENRRPGHGRFAGYQRGERQWGRRGEREWGRRESASGGDGETGSRADGEKGSEGDEETEIETPTAVLPTTAPGPVIQLVTPTHGEGENGSGGEGENGSGGDGETGSRGDGETGSRGDGENPRGGDWESQSGGDWEPGIDAPTAVVPSTPEEMPAQLESDPRPNATRDLPEWGDSVVEHAGGAVTLLCPAEWSIAEVTFGREISVDGGGQSQAR